MSFNVTSSVPYQLPFSLPPISPDQAQRAQGLVSFFFADGFMNTQANFAPQLGQLSQFGGSQLGQLGQFSGQSGLLGSPAGYSQTSVNQAVGMLGGFFAAQSNGMSQMGSLQGMMGAMFSNQQSLMPMQYGSFMAAQGFGFAMATQPGVGIRAGSAVGKDEFATHSSCRTGKDNPSNMNNSDHIKLALYDMLQKSDKKRGEHSSLGSDWQAIADRLQKDYGIKAEVTTVTSKEGDKLKALKFENGAVMADGAGDGQLDMGDYNFKGAIEDIESRYGMKADELIGALKNNGGFAQADQVAAAHHRVNNPDGTMFVPAAGGKDTAWMMGGAGFNLQSSQGLQGMQGLSDPQQMYLMHFLSQMQNMMFQNAGQQDQMYPAQQIGGIFAQAYIAAY